MCCQRTLYYSHLNNEQIISHIPPNCYYFIHETVVGGCCWPCLVVPKEFLFRCWLPMSCHFDLTCRANKLWHFQTYLLYLWSGLSSSHPTKRSFMAQFGGTWFQFYKSPKKKPESYCHEIACNNIIGLIYFISHPIAMVSILVRLVVNPLIKQINTNNLGLPIVQLHGLMGYINIIIISLRLSWRQRRWRW